MKSLKILGICGSLRKNSTNKGLLRAASSFIIDDDVKLQTFDISQIPLYDEDLNIPKKPEIVLKAYDAVANSDGLFMAAPEYNYNLTPALKNFIDWVSRGQSPLRDKPLGYVHSGMTMSGHIDKAIKNTVDWVNMKVYVQKQFKVKATRQNFDGEGNLLYDHNKQKLKEYFEGYLSFVKNNK